MKKSILAILIIIFCQIDSTIQEINPSFGQCGGKKWVGSRICSIKENCVFINEFFSQCLPINWPAPAKPYTSYKNSKPTKCNKCYQ